MTGPHESWFARAAEDLRFAELGLSHGYNAQVCFLAQQAAEKSLKGFLIQRSGTHPRSHNLVGLLNRCAEVVPEVLKLEGAARILDQYYLPSRYPDGVPGGSGSEMPEARHATEALELAKKIYSVSARLAE